MFASTWCNEQKNCISSFLTVFFRSVTSSYTLQPKISWSNTLKNFYHLNGIIQKASLLSLWLALKTVNTYRIIFPVTHTKELLKHVRDSQLPGFPRNIVQPPFSGDRHRPPAHGSTKPPPCLELLYCTKFCNARLLHSWYITQCWVLQRYYYGTSHPQRYSTSYL